jgi:hypothetical protein
VPQLRGVDRHERSISRQAATALPRVLSD